MSDAKPVGPRTRRELAQLLTRIEAGAAWDFEPGAAPIGSPIVGVTGPPGVGKSSLISAIVAELRKRGSGVAVLAVDPSSPYTSGALLGDRIRMTEHLGDDRVYIRSFASRGRLGGLSAGVPAATRALQAYGFESIIVETVGVGQGEVDIATFADATLVVQAPQLGDDLQAGKAGILEIADIVVVNKADLAGAGETLRNLSTELHLVRSGARPVPVVATQATTGSGVAELCDALGQLCAAMADSGELVARRTARRLREWQDRAQVLLGASLRSALASPAGQALATEVGTGRRSVPAAVLELAAMAMAGIPAAPEVRPGVR